MVEWIPEWLARRYAEMYIVRREFSLREAVEIWNVRYSTARKILSDLAKKGWIKEVKKNEEKTYVLASPEEVIFKFASVYMSKALTVAVEISLKHKDVLFFGSLVTLKYGHGRAEDYLVVITKLHEEHALEGKSWAVPVEVLPLADTKMIKKSKVLLHEGRRLKIPSLEDSIVLFAYCIFYKGLALRLADFMSLMMEPQKIEWEYLLERSKKFKVSNGLYNTLMSIKDESIPEKVLRRLKEISPQEFDAPYMISKKEIKDAYKKVRELW
jgi:hypothetical protein